jgi:hypothetical protein
MRCTPADIDQARLRPGAVSHPERVRARLGEAAQHTSGACIPPLPNVSHRCSPARGLPRQPRKLRDGRGTRLRCRTKPRCSRCQRRSDGAGLAHASAVTERSEAFACVHRRRCILSPRTALDTPRARLRARVAPGLRWWELRKRCLRSASSPHTPCHAPCMLSRARRAPGCVVGSASSSASFIIRSRCGCRACPAGGASAPPPGPARRLGLAGRG